MHILDLWQNSPTDLRCFSLHARGQSQDPEVPVLQQVLHILQPPLQLLIFLDQSSQRGPFTVLLVFHFSCGLLTARQQLLCCPHPPFQVQQARGVGIHCLVYRLDCSHRWPHGRLRGLHMHLSCCCLLRVHNGLESQQRLRLLITLHSLLSKVRNLQSAVILPFSMHGIQILSCSKTKASQKKERIKHSPLLCACVQFLFYTTFS